MGFEAENNARLKAFDGWIVDQAKMSRAKKDALFMHCLPAHRGEEVAAEVIDGPQSVVWDEAENRLHVQKALLEYLVHGRFDEAACHPTASTLNTSIIATSRSCPTSCNPSRSIKKSASPSPAASIPAPR
jgi:hypothetical protein